MNAKRENGLKITAAIIAHHEAGHAVTLWLGARGLGLSLPNAGLISVKIPSVPELEALHERIRNGERPNGFSGITEYDNAAFINASGQRETEVAIALAVQALAGLAAEHQFLREIGDPWGLRSFQEHLAETRDDGRFSIPQCAAELRAGRMLPDMDRMRWFADIAGRSEQQIIGRTREYIRMPRAWCTIQALAEMLLVKNIMTGEEATNTMQAAWDSK